jgi:predicted nucleic acid-binding protein
MNEQIIHINPNYLVDTGVFVAWARGETAAHEFFHHPPGRIYYSKQTRKELLHPHISSSELRKLKRFLIRFRIINPDDAIAQVFSELLTKYPYLKSHLPDALIAATALVKNMILVCSPEPLVYQTL